MQHVAAAVASAALVFSTLAAGQSVPKDNPECKPNPVFQKFPRSFHESCERSRFAALQLEVAKDPSRADSPVETVTKEGEYWYYNDPIVKEAAGRLPSALEIRRNYENAVRAAGGTVLARPSYGTGLYYRLAKGGSEYWGFVYCGTGSPAECEGVSHKIVRVAGMEQSVVVSADQIAKDMGAGGKVVFYGIYFDTDKAAIKPESGPTLAEMAKWLKANARTKVYIVGHTDMQGAHDHNMKLSRDRAASVVAALAGQHGIAKERLASEGVGPLAPVASNADETGRAKNRRVEMVLR